MSMFRKLSEREEKEFQEVARAEYKPCSEINEFWHPIYRDECVKINNEYHNKLQGNLN